MNAFKRFCLFIFALAGLISLSILGLPEFGISLGIVSEWLLIGWVYIVFEVCLGICVLGLLIFLLTALFAPRKRDTLLVYSSTGDVIKVSREAIKSQIAHIIEHDGRFSLDFASVKIIKKGKSVDVAVRIQPHQAIDVVKEGTALQTELKEGLIRICGERIHHLGLEFIESSSYDELSENLDLELDEKMYQSSSSYRRDDSSENTDTDMVAEEITLPMGHSMPVDTASENKENVLATNEVSVSITSSERGA